MPALSRQGLICRRARLRRPRKSSPRSGPACTIHVNSVKLQATAVVDGEIFKQSLVIEQNAQFEGVSRRLEKAVDAPTADQVNGQGASQTRGSIGARVVDSVPTEPAYANGNGSAAADPAH